MTQENKGVSKGYAETKKTQMRIYYIIHLSEHPDQAKLSVLLRVEIGVMGLSG